MKRRAKARAPRCAALVMGALVSLTAQSKAGSEQLFVESRQAMGTTFTIHLYAADGEQASAYFDAAFEEIERLDEALSNYRASSELSRINRLAGQEPVTTDPEVFQLLERSLAYGRRSGGAFDITVGPLMRAWGFFRGEGRYPGADDLAKARASVGWQHVVLEPGTRTVRFLLPAIELDLGGIGKGYAVDCVVALLRKMGVKSALVDAGSSTIYAIGAPPGKPGWKVRVPQPGNRLQTIFTVVLRDTSLSTSGSYEKFFSLHGHTYGHIMNPQTGEPVQGVLQTTVIAPEATDSDALSTAVFVMGPVKGKRLLQGVAGARAFWVLGNPQVPRTATWRWPGRDCGNPRANCAVSSPVATQHHRGREQGRQR